MRINQALVCLVAMFAVGCVSKNGVTPVVSPLQLRITPDKFDGREVDLIGYLDTQTSRLGGATLIFQSRDDARIMNVATSVPVFLGVVEPGEVAMCADSYVELRGEFKKQEAGGYGLEAVQFMMKRDLAPIVLPGEPQTRPILCINRQGSTAKDDL